MKTAIVKQDICFKFGICLHKNAVVEITKQEKDRCFVRIKSNPLIVYIISKKDIILKA
jgi:hypothetical protein